MGYRIAVKPSCMCTANTSGPQKGGLCTEVIINGKGALGPNKVVFIERWSLYRGQN